MNEMVTQKDADSISTALKNSLYPGASDESVGMVLAYCRAARLDPMTKPVHIVPMSVKTGKKKPNGYDEYAMRDVIMPGIELYRTKAVETGVYAGQDEVVFGDDVSETVGKVKMTFPKWAKVTVYRIVTSPSEKSMKVPFTAKVFWMEAYSTTSREDMTPNSMWRKRPYGQLEKCAEALALRKAFPDAIGAQQTAEEMEGKELYVTDIEPTDKVTMPRALQQEQAEDASFKEKDPEKASEKQPDQNKVEVQPDSGLLSSGMQKVLNSKLSGAGLTMDALVAGFGNVTAGNINKALEWVKTNVKAPT